MARKEPHPMDGARDAALKAIKAIARRAVTVYADHDIRTDETTHILDLTMCHFGPQKLRLDDLLAADNANFMHDIAGINRHLDRMAGTLSDGFSPRFSAR